VANFPLLEKEEVGKTSLSFNRGLNLGKTWGIFVNPKSMTGIDTKKRKQLRTLTRQSKRQFKDDLFQFKRGFYIGFKRGRN